MSHLPWMKRPGLFGTVDGGTAAVIVLWAGLWVPLISRPKLEARAMIRPPSPDCMIVAWREPLEELPLALRPDLVALPSPVSFGAYGSAIDSLYGVPSIPHHPAFSGYLLEPVMKDDLASVASLESTVAEEGAHAVGRLRFPDMHYAGLEVKKSVTPIRQTVIYSDGLGGTRLKPDAFEGLAGMDEGRRVEIELTIAFDDKGIPESVFLERGSGNPDVDRELVRRSWNPANWLHPKGRGTVRIR